MRVNAARRASWKQGGKDSLLEYQNQDWRLLCEEAAGRRQERARRLRRVSI
jgi:hypothetical protein